MSEVEKLEEKKKMSKVHFRDLDWWLKIIILYGSLNLVIDIIVLLATAILFIWG